MRLCPPPAPPLRACSRPRTAPLGPWPGPPQPGLQGAAPGAHLPAPDGAGTAGAGAGAWGRPAPGASGPAPGAGPAPAVRVLGAVAFPRSASDAPSATAGGLGGRGGLPALRATPRPRLPAAARGPRGGRTPPAGGGGGLPTPSPRWGAPVFRQGRLRGTWSPGAPSRGRRQEAQLGHHAAWQARQAASPSTGWQGPRGPSGEARCRGGPRAWRSPASQRGSVRLPPDALQAYAAPPTEWAAARHPKGAARPCIRAGLAPFLHGACTAHSDCVVKIQALDIVEVIS